MRASESAESLWITVDKHWQPIEVKKKITASRFGLNCGFRSLPEISVKIPTHRPVPDYGELPKWPEPSH